MSSSAATPEASPQQGDARGFGLGAGAILGGLLGSRLCRLLTRVAIARLLGAATLGVFDLAWTVVYLASFVTPIGLHTAVVRFGATIWRRDPAAFRQFVWRSLRGALALGTLAAATLMLLSGPLSRHVFGQPEVAGALLVLALLIPFAGGLQVLTAGTQAMQRMRYTAYLRELLPPAVQLVLFLGFFSLGYGLGGALWATVLGFAVAFGVALPKVKRLMATAMSPVEEPPSWRTVLGFSLPVAFTSMMTALLFMVDRLIVGAMRPPAELGVYSATAQMSVLQALALSALTTTLVPRFAQLRDLGETERVRRLFRLCTRWGICLIAPITAVLLVSPQAVLVGIFGGEFSGGAVALRVLVIGQLANAFSGPVGVALVTGDRQRLWLLLSGLALALNVVLDVLLLPRFGIVGAAWGSTIALFLLFLSASIMVFRFFRLQPYDGRSVRLVPPVVGALLGALGIAMFLDAGALWVTVCSLAASGLGLLGGIALVGLEPEDREMLAGLRDRLVGR